MSHEYADEVRLLSDYYLMNGVRGMYIRHLMSMKEEERFRILRTFVENRQATIPVFTD